MISGPARRAGTRQTGRPSGQTHLSCHARGSTDITTVYVPWGFRLDALTLQIHARVDQSAWRELQQLTSQWEGSRTDSRICHYALSEWYDYLQSHPNATFDGQPLCVGERHIQCRTSDPAVQAVWRNLNKLMKARSGVAHPIALTLMLRYALNFLMGSLREPVTE